MSRARLIKHLSERRVRVKARTVTCYNAFMASNPVTIAEGERHRCEANDSDCFRKAQKEGHTNIIATIPYERLVPNILKKRIAHKQAGERNDHAAKMLYSQCCTNGIGLLNSLTPDVRLFSSPSPSPLPSAQF